MSGTDLPEVSHLSKRCTSEHPLTVGACLAAKSFKVTRGRGKPVHLQGSWLQENDKRIYVHVTYVIPPALPVSELNPCMRENTPSVPTQIGVNPAPPNTAL